MNYNFQTTLLKYLPTLTDFFVWMNILFSTIGLNLISNPELRSNDNNLRQFVYTYIRVDSKMAK